jgi:glycosyltransferase involved in cell wall biosynthesis
VRAQPGAVLLTTGPPFSCHLVGLLVTRLTGVPWVADFRDPWRLPDKYAAHRNAATDALEARWIRAVARRADRITSVTDRMTIQMRQDHPDVPPSKIVTLTSGFDRDDLAGLDEVRPPAPPVIVSYLGTFYHGRSPEPFLRGLKALLDEGALRRDEIAVRFIGHVATAEGRPVDQMIRQMGLEGVVTLTGPVSRREALQRSMQSHVVLILDEKHPAQIPYKLYEGMVTGALIFNIGSEGAVRDVLMKTQTGVACRYDDPEAIKRGILECCERVRAGWHSPDAARSRAAMVRDYDFRSITAQLSRYLNECS